jgi:site-specific DNA recombinase
VRAAIYTRVSLDRTGKARSVDEQEAECREAARREGWTVVRVFTDNDRSASRYARKDRPAFRELSAFVAERGCDVIMTWEASRAARDLSAYVQLRDLARDTGTRLWFSGRAYDLSDADDEFQVTLQMGLSEREAGITRKRVLRSVRANAVAGRPHGKLLYGYTRQYDERGQLVAQVPREDQASVVREASRRVAAGEARNAIAKDFNARGIAAPRGGSWDLTQIRRLVTNPAYIAKRVHQGKIVGDATWPPILDQETFYTCVDRINDPTKKTTRDGTLKHLLSGIALCGVCKGRMRVQRNRGFLAYICIEGFCVSRKQVWVDDAVTQLVLARLSQPDAHDLIAGDEQVEDARSASAKAAEKRARLNEFYDAAARGEITPAALARIEAQLLPEIEAAEDRAREARIVPVLRGLVRPDIEAVWPSLSIDRQRQAVDALMTLYVMPARRGARSFDPETLRVEWKV